MDQHPGRGRNSGHRRQEMNENEKLGTIIANEQFPIADHRLRRGAHIAVEDVELYDFVRRHFPELSSLYHRYEAALKEGAEGYFYLISEGSIFGQRQLSKAEMLIGLTIAHLYRDPENRVRGTGQLTVEQVISRLETLKSQDDIARIPAQRVHFTARHRQKRRRLLVTEFPVRK